MKITLLRHAEVEERYKGCYNGHLDIPLSEAGHEQARRLAERFAGERFDAVYCSDLLRARQTLEPFGLDAEAIFTPLLREKSWGRHEGKRFEEIVARERLAYENFEQWITALDGEGVEAYRERIAHFFMETLPKAEHQNVLVVTHAGVIRTLMHLVEGITLEEAFGIAFPCGFCVIYDTETKRFGEVLCA